MEKNRANVKNIVNHLFKANPQVLELLPVGLTNEDWYFEVNEKGYVLRYPFFRHTHAPLEKQVLQMIKPLDLDAPLVFFDEKTGIKITRYLPDAVTYRRSKDPDKLVKVAYMMRRLHKAQLTCGKEFDPFKKLELYRSKAGELAHPDIDEYLPFVETVKGIYNPSCLCHNDWVDGNILFTPRRSYLIDYEYAGDNDPLFDVMSFLSENNITDKQLRERFYFLYFQSVPDKEVLAKLAIWERFHNMLWYYWAEMMYKYRQDEEIFRTIAEDKYEAFKNSPVTEALKTLGIR